MRQTILNELAEDREAIRSAVDLVKILADVAVVAAQQAEVGKLTQTRQHIETLYQKREAGYLKEQQDWEQFVQNAQSILETAAREWNDLRAKAVAALEQSDQDQLRFRDLALAREQQRLREHIARWHRDLEDLRNRGPSIDGEKLLDGIQLVLDFAGFIPVIGAGPDVINTIISAGRGNWGDAAVNAIAIIPFWGDAAKGGKMLAKAGQEGLQHADEISAVVHAVARHGDDIPESLTRTLPDGWGRMIEEIKRGDEIVINGIDEVEEKFAFVKDGIIHLNLKEFDKLTPKQRATVFFHELRHALDEINSPSWLKRFDQWAYSRKRGNLVYWRALQEFRAELYGSGRLFHSAWFAVKYDGWKFAFTSGKIGGTIIGTGFLYGLLEMWSEDDTPTE